MLISESIQVMRESHEGQRRKSGELFETHPLAVARIYRSIYPTDVVGQSVCFLHDCIEDTWIGVRVLSGFFGRELGLMVDALSRRPIEEFRCREDCEDEYYGRLFAAARMNARIAVVKLCDRMDNLRTVDVLGPEKARKIISQTEERLTPFFRELRLPLTEELAWLCSQKRRQLRSTYMLGRILK